MQTVNAKVPGSSPGSTARIAAFGIDRPNQENQHGVVIKQKVSVGESQNGLAAVGITLTAAIIFTMILLSLNKF